MHTSSVECCQLCLHAPFGPFEVRRSAETCPAFLCFRSGDRDVDGGLKEAATGFRTRRSGIHSLLPAELFLVLEGRVLKL